VRKDIPDLKTGDSTMCVSRFLDVSVNLFGKGREILASPEPAEAADSETETEVRHGIVVYMVLYRIIARDADPLRLHLLCTAGITPLAEASNTNRITLNLELVSRGIVLGILAHAARIAESGRVIVGVIPGIRIRVMVDDTTTTLRDISLGSYVVGNSRVGRGASSRFLLCRWGRFLGQGLPSAGGTQAPAECAWP
jgi:hypothetical protein